MSRASPGLRLNSPEGVEGAAEPAGVGGAVGGESAGVVPKVFFILIFLFSLFFALTRAKAKQNGRGTRGSEERRRGSGSEGGVVSTAFWSGGNG